MIDWKRVKRTLIQSATGGAVALITSITADFKREVVIASLVQFASTVLIAVLMNINKQVEEGEE